MPVFQKSNVSPIAKESNARSSEKNEETESYLNHPTLGLLYCVCRTEDNQELFTTIYAKRLFFLVTTSATTIKFEPISRTEARLMVEINLSRLRRLKDSQEYEKLYTMYQQTF